MSDDDHQLLIWPPQCLETWLSLPRAIRAVMCQHFSQFRPIQALESTIASLSVRKLDDETLSRLRIRAAKHGVSMEEEARRILKEAVSAPDHLGDFALGIFGPKHGVDLQLPERTPHEPLDLTE